MWPKLRLFTASLVALPALAGAQLPSIMGGLPGLPKISSMPIGNVAGVLQYCAKNQLLGGKDVQSMVGGLTKKGASTSSTDYKAGAAGQILGGKKPMSLSGLSGDMKSQACGMVMKQAKHLI